MGQDNPLILLVMLTAAGVVAWWWWTDFQAARGGHSGAKSLPGATVAAGRGVALAAVGAVLLLLAESWGEYRLGLVAKQSKMTALFGLYSLAAAFVEELIFRGYLVVEGRGRSALWAGVIAASLVFALLHPFLWEWREGTLHLQTDTKAWFSTAAIFAGSLWFYTVRFWRLNPTQSLWPCLAAHAVKNLGVILIKLAQGYVSGWW